MGAETGYDAKPDRFIHRALSRQKKEEAKPTDAGRPARWPTKVRTGHFELDFGKLERQFHAPHFSPMSHPPLSRELRRIAAAVAHAHRIGGSADSLLDQSRAPL